MADDLINLGASPTDAILGNSAITPDLLSQPLSPQTVQDNQNQPMLPQPTISQAIQSLGIGLINGDQSGRGIAGGLADAATMYDGQKQVALRNALIQQQSQRADRQQQLSEYELLGRMRSRQLTEAALLQKQATIAKLKQENPEIAPLIDLDPKIAAKALAAKASAQSGGANSDLTGQDLLNTLNPEDKANVQGIVAGKLDPKMFSRSGKTAYYTGLAARVDPTFDAVNYGKRVKTVNDFATGPAATTVNQLKTALNHGNDLYDKIDGLDNLSGFPLVTYANMAKNFLADKSGSKAVNDYNNILGKYVKESTSVYSKTGGSEEERKDAQSSLGDDKTADQLKSALSGSTNMMMGKLDALDDQYRQGTGTNLKYQFLSPKQRGILVKMGQADPTEVGVDASAANLKDNTPPEPIPPSSAIDQNQTTTPPIRSSVFANSIGPVPTNDPAAMPEPIQTQGMLDDDPDDDADDTAPTAATSSAPAFDPKVLSDDDIQRLADKYQTTPDVVKQQLGL